MADTNLQIAITADASKLRADLAVAQASVRSFAAQMRQAADAARISGDNTGLQKLAGSVLQAEASVKALKNELRSTGSAPIAESMSESFRVLPGLMLRARESVGSLKEGMEAAAAAFAVERIAEWAAHMAEAGEVAVHTAAAVGLSVEDYLGVAGAMQLAGGNAENATRALVMLQQRMQSAVEAPDSKLMDAFSQAGISFEKLHEALVSGDVKGILGDLADAWVRMGESADRTATFVQLFGARQLREMVPALEKGSAGLAEGADKARSMGAANAELAKNAAETGEKLNTLAVALRGLKEQGFELLRPAVDFFTEGLTNMIATAGTAIEVLNALKDVVSRKLGFGEGGVVASAAIPPPAVGAGGGGSGRMRDWLAAHGYTPQAAAGVMGNAQVESGFNPAAGLGTAHQGLFQWDKNRWQGGDFDAQMAHMDAELAKLDPAFKTATASAGALAARFEGVFERSGGQLLAQRQSAAEGAYNTGQGAVPDFAVAAAKKAFEAELEKRKVVAEEVHDYATLLDLAKAKANFDKASPDEQRRLLIQSGYGTYGAAAANQAAAGSKADTDVARVQSSATQYAQRTQLAQLDQQIEQVRVSGANDALAQIAAIEKQKAALIAGNAQATASEQISAQTRVIAATAAATKEAFTLAEQRYERTKAIGELDLQQYTATEQAKVALGQESRAEEVANVKTHALQLLAEQKAGLEQLRAEYAKTPAELQKIADQIKAIDVKSAVDRAQELQKLAEDQKALMAKWTAPVKQFFDALGSSIESSIAGLATRKTTWAQAYSKILDSVTTSAISGAGGLASKGIASALGAKAGEGLGDFLGSKLLSTLGLGGSAASTATLTASGTALTASATALTSSAAALSAAAATLGAGGAASAATGIAGSTVGGAVSSGIGSRLFSGLGALFAFRRGGIVPSAAGGWALPSFAGATPALLHSREMVLPAQISEGLQRMIGEGGSGSGGGGGAAFHVHFYGPSDGPSVDRWFRSNMVRNTSVVQRAATANRLLSARR